MHGLIESGLLAEEAQALLQSFFLSLRQKRLAAKLARRSADTPSSQGDISNV